jgi:hypothetical protein
MRTRSTYVEKQRAQENRIGVLACRRVGVWPRDVVAVGEWREAMLAGPYQLAIHHAPLTIHVSPFLPHAGCTMRYRPIAPMQFARSILGILVGRKSEQAEVEA